jgi:UDP-glucose 4-epimerase
MTQKILVTGGAGYIGSHMVKLLLDAHYDVVTLDDLSTGFRDAVSGGEFVQVSLLDEVALDAVFAAHQFDAVIHFAGAIAVGESVQHPEKYYKINVLGTLNLLSAMRKHEVNRIIFSSTAAVFGMPQTSLINENHPKLPINPYGWTKYMIENVLRDFHVAYGLKYGILRYFNASGAHPHANLGERHFPETHLIPLAMFAALSPEKPLKIFGNDYATPDGTCVRDYVHICDLCDAHLLVLRELLNKTSHLEYNLGNGSGYSVLDVIHAVERVSGKTVQKSFAERRAGDPAQLVADSSLIRQTLGWAPKYEALDTIIAHAWDWEVKQKRYAAS